MSIRYRRLKSINNSVYLHSHKPPELISPDNWTMDTSLREGRGARQVRMEFFYNYSANVALYPQWQEALRSCQPTTHIFRDKLISSSPPGGKAYLIDLTQRSIAWIRVTLQ